ncbi:MAG: hypothetical protein HRU01_03260 [Myxococcales bacterium]|nr:hypothetical protein [Myxococcales bacterium]
MGRSNRRGESAAGIRTSGIRTTGLRVVLAWAFALMTVGASAASPLERGNPTFRLPGTDAASEYWDFIARLDTGHLVLSRFSVTNEGPGERTAYMIGHVVFPDGRTVQFEKGKRDGEWRLTDDGLFIGVGDNFIDHRGVVRRMKIDRRSIVIDLLYKPDEPVGLASPVHRGVYWVDVLHTGAPVKGTLFVPGMDAPIAVRGSIASTHTWMTESEPDVALRRVEVFSLDRRTGVYLQDVATPQGDRHRWLVVEEAGRELLRTDRFDLRFEGRNGALGADYPVPARLVISGPHVEGEIELGRVLASDDPMRVVPQPFRFLLSFKMKPRRLWADAPFEITIKNPPGVGARSVSGTGLLAIMFTNPAPGLR